MKALLPAILEELQAGRPCTLVWIVRAKGSAPRGAGAAMLVRADGSTIGTIGGGLVEHRATIDAQSGAIGLRDYSLTPVESAGLGMVCGGAITVCFRRIEPSTLPLWETLQAKVQRNEPCWLAFQTEGEMAMQVATPNHLPFQLPESVCRRQPSWWEDRVFVLPVVRAGHAYVFGGGHIAQQLVPLLAKLNFAPIVFEDRPEFATKALFPDAEQIILGDYTAPKLHIMTDDQWVIMTRGHLGDQQLLAHALRSPANYIGLIGSRSKIANTKSLLFQQGFSEEDFARVHTPVGLPILAETPMEIAVSIAAEMILHRATLSKQD